MGASYGRRSGGVGVTNPLRPPEAGRGIGSRRGSSKAPTREAVHGSQEPPPQHSDLHGLVRPRDVQSSP